MDDLPIFAFASRVGAFSFIPKVNKYDRLGRHVDRRCNAKFAMLLPEMNTFDKLIYYLWLFSIFAVTFGSFSVKIKTMFRKLIWCAYGASTPIESTVGCFILQLRLLHNTGIMKLNIFFGICLIFFCFHFSDFFFFSVHHFCIGHMLHRICLSSLRGLSICRSRYQFACRWRRLRKYRPSSSCGPTDQRTRNRWTWRWTRWLLCKWKWSGNLECDNRLLQPNGAKRLRQRENLCFAAFKW